MELIINDKNVDLSKLEIGKEYILDLDNVLNNRIHIDDIDIKNNKIIYHEVVNTNKKHYLKPSGKVDMFDNTTGRKICSAKTFTEDIIKNNLKGE